MGELSIRRNRGFAVPTKQEVSKTTKSSSAAKSQKASTPSKDVAVSETMRPRNTQSASQIRESRRALQTGEAVLAEVQDSLSRMSDLAKQAAGGGEIDRDALQAELEQLQETIDRMLSGGTTSGVQLFASEEIPDWLTQGITDNSLTSQQLLSALGLDQSASGADLLAAIASHPADGNTATSYLASLYLGAVIAGGGTENLDPEQALDGLRQLMDKVADGMPIDEAIKELTNGEFTSVEDFQNQFSQGEAPGMEEFLTNLLLSDTSAAALVMPQLSLLDFLSGMEGMNFDLLMGLLSAAGQTTELAQELVLDASGNTPDGAAAAMAEANAPEPAAAAAPSSTVQMGNVQITGEDLSGVSFNESTGVVTVAGTADVTIQSVSQEPQAIQITGSGTVTLENVNASTVTVDAPEAHIASAGQSQLGQIRLGENTTLTLNGSGTLRVNEFHGSAANTLRLQSGAVIIPGKNGETFGKLTIPVIMEGPAVLAAQAVHVQSAGGKTMEPMDIVWKALFLGFNMISSLEMNGQHAKMSLTSDQHSGLVRLWMEKGDLSAHGYPVYALAIRGEDKLGQLKTRYAYLYWNQRNKKFEEVSMYPNPFTVTGGEAGRDWVYEEDTHTLRILSGQVVAVSGGVGIDARQEPFSGRIAFGDSIGAMELVLGGVVCRVTSGRAFHLGRENDVTLLLQSGSRNFFESGAGCAGISLGQGTSLRIDCPAASKSKEPVGSLTATGGEGSAGIGRDSGSTEQIGPILLRGGSGLGTGQLNEMQSITIAGGSVTANGGKKVAQQKKRWMQRSVSLQMGEYTAIVPQFRLSTSALQLNKLRVSTREYAQAAMITIDEGRRWVSQIQSTYNTLYSQLDSRLRDDTAANALLDEMRQMAPQMAAQAAKTQRDSIRRLLG